MSQTKPAGKPNFFWQGLFILFPVVIMAIVGISAIRQDRAAVEREAQQRAEEILQQINVNFGRQANIEMNNYERYLGIWSDEIREKTPWPGGSMSKALEKVRKENLPYRTSLSNSVLEGTTPLEVERSAIKFWPKFNLDGSIRSGWSSFSTGKLAIDVPPKPPEWRLQLSPQQLAAWEALEQAVYSSHNNAQVQKAYAEFTGSRPSHPARVNADFMLLQSKLAGQAASVAISNQLEFASTIPLPPSASGIPLSTLNVAELLKTAAVSGSTEEIWSQLTREVFYNPNFSTPELLSLAEPLTKTNLVLTDALNALRSHWEAIQQLWEVGEAIQRTDKLATVGTSNYCAFWFTFNEANFFCVLSPRLELSPSDTNGPMVTNRYIQSLLFPATEISREFHRAMKSANVTVPAYFGVAAELEGSQPFIFDDATAKADKTNMTVLAQSSGSIPLQSVFVLAPDGKLAATGPHYTLQIHLTDRDLMLATHQQRARLFGGLIIVSALVAFSGFVAAYRAFKRQLYLSEMKSNFVSSVSHELRAPIASVRLLAESLERGKVQQPEKQHEYFQFIVQECRRLSSLIENVLDFSRIEQGRRQYEMESTDLAALTAQTVALMQTVAEEKNIRIIFQRPTNPLPAEVDGKAMQQALVNLLDNAIKHSPNGSEIKVGLEFRADHIELSVEDQGEGIPAAEHEKIFERFYRIGSELRRKTQGVGIGLSIVKHIVEGHGGRIRLRSAPGAGSRFTIELPMK